MSASSRASMELAIRRIMMSSQIVSSKKVKGGKDYQIYVGASLITATKLAKIHSLLKAGLIPKDFMPYIKIYAIYLDQLRKAEFTSIGTDPLSKLGFILGDPRETIRVTRPESKTEREGKDEEREKGDDTKE